MLDRVLSMRHLRSQERHKMNRFIIKDCSFKEKENDNDAVNDNDNIASDNETNAHEESSNTESESSDDEDNQMEIDEQLKSDVRAALGDSTQNGKEENQGEVLMETPVITSLVYLDVVVFFFFSSCFFFGGGELRRWFLIISFEDYILIYFNFNGILTILNLFVFKVDTCENLLLI